MLFELLFHNLVLVPATQYTENAKIARWQRLLCTRYRRGNSSWRKVFGFDTKKYADANAFEKIGHERLATDQQPYLAWLYKKV
jgi:hypothetical protein